MFAHPLLPVQKLTFFAIKSMWQLRGNDQRVDLVLGVQRSLVLITALQLAHTLVSTGQPFFVFFALIVHFCR